MRIESVRNSGVLSDQIISGRDDVEVQELSLPFTLSARSLLYVHAILTVAPERIEAGEKLIAKIRLEQRGSTSEPVDYGPYGYRSSDPESQHSFVVDTDLDLIPGDYTAKIVASISDTGADAYRLRAQGSCRMTLLVAPQRTWLWIPWGRS